SLGRLLQAKQGRPRSSGPDLEDSEIALWLDLQRREILTLGNEVGAWCEPAERRLGRIIHMVVDIEQIAARTRRDIAVRTMHGVAVEEQHAARRPGGGVDTMTLGQPGQAVVIRYAELLLAQRLFIMIFRGGAHAADELLVRAGDQHQRAVVRLVVG